MLVCIPVFFHVKVEFKTAFNFKNVIIMKEELFVFYSFQYKKFVYYIADQ